MTLNAHSSVCNLSALDRLNETSIAEIAESWNGFCFSTEALLNGNGNPSCGPDFAPHVHTLCKHGLRTLAEDHFLNSVQEIFEKNCVLKCWQNFDAYSNVGAPELCNDSVSHDSVCIEVSSIVDLLFVVLDPWEGAFSALQMQDDEVQQVLCKALREISLEKQYQEKCLSILVHALQSYKDSTLEGRLTSDVGRAYLVPKYQLIVSSVLMTSLPRHFPEVLHWYFKGKLEELSTKMAGEYDDIGEAQEKDDMDLDENPMLAYSTRDMDLDGCHLQRTFLENSRLVKNSGVVVHDLRSLGFTSLTEDAYASAIFLLLKAKVHDLAGEDYRSSVLESIKGWIQAVPLQFLHALLAYLGDSVSYNSPSSSLKSPLASQPSACYTGNGTPSEGLVRWQLRLEYFAYETLQDLRIAKLFEIIVDYPDSMVCLESGQLENTITGTYFHKHDCDFTMQMTPLQNTHAVSDMNVMHSSGHVTELRTPLSPAIDDLKRCLEYTGQHSKLVDSFISALRYRLLTAGASTNDILLQYVSTIKALRTIDPAGVFLEAVGEPIREYLKGRKDTIKCIVTMLTDGTSGNPNGPGNIGDSLLEELNRNEENQDSTEMEDDINTNDKQAWVDAERWEPDPVEADPLKGSRQRRKVDILGMIVGIIGSKDQLVNEYRVMLAEKLLNKTEYDINSEIRTLELLKIHFGENSMQKCEIMLNDLIDSKRINTNVKATIVQPSQNGAEFREHEVSLDTLDATIISSNFWPPIQEEALNIPEPVDQLLSDYAKRFGEIKTPRKLQWKKNLGTVKLELQFGDREMQFTVAPVHASIIMQFQDQMSWTSINLATAIGVPIDVLNRRINFWISKGILAESLGNDSNDHIYTLVDSMVDTGKTGLNSGSCEDLVGDEDGERSVASVEDQLRKEMTVYEPAEVFSVDDFCRVETLPFEKVSTSAVEDAYRKFITGMLTNFGSMALDRIHNTLKMFCVADPSYDKSLQQLQSFLSGLVMEEKLELRDEMYFLKK
ncbi:hypothetical protein RJ639_020480 [Escallonia herrerae]|uniref:Anaphase-promoting complex subunit 2 n=1 Tax=Escallonia herrerae TaxID=1293975 RepID=A0AA89AGN0_9ASTE|nr:hypothetical protein RJ639_020480 [Escallonia herrerae]